MAGKDGNMLKIGLDNRVALVTGANHGIGAAIAKSLAAQGCRVMLTYFRLPVEPSFQDAELETPGQAAHDRMRGEDAAQVVEAIRAGGGVAEALEVDLSQPDQIPALYDATEASFGGVEILVNNAAAWRVDMLAPAPEDQAADQQAEAYRQHQLLDAASHDFHFAVNSRATALMMVEFGKRHAQRQRDWGRIINISTGGSAGFPGEVSYGASKAALESYSRAAAQELGRYGITVNIVIPGPTQTGWITPDMAAEFVQRTPLRRLGFPQDIANAVLLLASEQAGWITGQTIHANGGY